MRISRIETAEDARIIGLVLALLRPTILKLSRMGWTVSTVYADDSVRMVKGDVFCFVHRGGVTPPATWETTHERITLRDSGIDVCWPAVDRREQVPAHIPHTVVLEDIPA